MPCKSTPACHLAGPYNTPDSYKLWSDWCDTCKSDLKVISELGRLIGAASSIDKLWDHTGTSMIDGYPKYLPSWDEFVSDLSTWLAEQRRVRGWD